ncbi:hypothetical protein XM73_c11781 [Vibrio vulnificus]|nr:hypothetical protein XM73_c11781 [Vibrio vulnificus]
MREVGVKGGQSACSLRTNNGLFKKERRSLISSLLSFIFHFNYCRIGRILDSLSNVS